MSQSAVGVCSICLTTPTEPILTNCGHVFCSQCILDYWHTDRHPRACRCPLCRREITLLIPQNGRICDRTLNRSINDYNRRQNDQSQPLAAQVRDTPTLVRFALQQLFAIHGMSCCSRLWIILCLFLAMIYLISPIDIIPEAIFGPFGFFDDIGSLLVALVYIANIFRQDLLQRIDQQ